MRHEVSPDVQLRVEADLANSKYTTDVGAQLEREKMANQREIETMKAKAKPKEKARAKAK